MNDALRKEEDYVAFFWQHVHPIDLEHEGRLCGEEGAFRQQYDASRLRTKQGTSTNDDRAYLVSTRPQQLGGL